MTTRADTGASHEEAAQSLYAHLELRSAADTYERAYAAYRREGDRLGAARAARMIGWIQGNIYGDWAVQSGWIGRAISLLEEAGEGTPEEAWVHAVRGTQVDDFETRCAHLRRAIDLGRRHHDPNVEFEALGWLGLILVLAGRVGEGMPMLDQALAAICAGEVSDLTVVEGTFCGFYYACEHTHDVARADQWIRAAEDVTQKRAVPTMGAFCRAHYGGILMAAGRWHQAEAELEQITRMFGDHTAMRSFALVRLADLRVRQGRLEEAEQLLAGLHEHHDAARPLAALYLARGETAIAVELLERTLLAPGFESAARAGPLLALLVDAHLAAGSTDHAAAATTRLCEHADEQPSQYLRAAADFARGRVAVAKGSPDARGHLSRALDGFAGALMPFDVARARLELARAASTTEVAVADAKEALAAFERLEASRDADEAAALLRSLGAPVRIGPKGREALTKREGEVLVLLGHGLSNPEIAERLFISRKTAEHHVGRILAKLGLRSRAEAAAYAAREGRPAG